MSRERLSHNAQSWIEAVLRERIAPTLLLERNGVGEDSFLVLRIAGHSGFIRFPPDNVALQIAGDPGPDMPCGHWSPTDCGLDGLLGLPLPTPGAVCSGAMIGPCQLDGEQGILLDYDLPGFMFWCLARMEEIGREDLDAHGRFPAASSFAARHDYLNRPVVDEWVDVLRQLVQRQWPELELTHSQFATCVSHDVDTPAKFAYASVPELARAMLVALLRDRNPRLVLDIPRLRFSSRSRFHPRDPFNTFEWLMETSERHGLVSAFYFICGTTRPSLDARYSPRDARIAALMARMAERGHEIGLHPSYETYHQPEHIKHEADTLRSVLANQGISQKAIGGRMHFLRWDQAVTLRALDDAGLAYDSTLGFADAAGFRCGTCHEYPAFDGVADAVLRIRLRPLVAMEVTVMGRQYMGLTRHEDAYDHFVQLKDRCRKVAGNFTLLWHNSSFSSDADFRLYEDILRA